MSADKPKSDKLSETVFDPQDSDQSAYLDSLIDQFDEELDLLEELNNPEQPEVITAVEIEEEPVDESELSEDLHDLTDELSEDLHELSDELSDELTDEPEEFDAPAEELESISEPEPTDETAAADEAESPDETPAEKETNQIIRYMGVAVLVAVLAIGIWLAVHSNGKDKVQIDIGQPVENAAVQPAPAPAPKPAPIEITPVQPKPVTLLPAPVEQAIPVTPEPAAPKPALAPTAEPKPVVSQPKAAAKPAIAWAINLTSVTSMASAQRIQAGLAKRGITTDITTATVNQRSYYRVRIPGFTSLQAAKQARTPLMKEREFNSAWIERYGAPQ